MTIPPFRSMHLLRGLLISIATTTCVALFVVWILVSPERQMETLTILVAECIPLNVISAMAYAYCNRLSAPPPPRRKMTLPPVSRFSNDWAYIRGYHALEDTPDEPFATVTIRACDLEELLRRAAD